MWMLLIAACSPEIVIDGAILDGDTGDPGVEDSAGDVAYDVEVLHTVEITLDPDDWETLRHQDRNLLDILGGEECLAEPFDSPYTWFVGSAVIDGTAFDQVEVRKKGLVGSVVSDRPSLKLDLDDHIDGQNFDGLEHITLNNGRQDASRVKTCLGYGIYRDAGLVASRCSYAHVTVNGEDLGIYANVEPIKAAFLRRNFGDDDANLYEGTLSDFREGWTDSFDDKTDASDYSDVYAVAEAVDADDPVAALEPLVDLDQFFEAWAADVLIGHWDSYPGNANNFYVYADPSDGRFDFIPWGIDAILVGDEPFGEGQPTGLVGVTALPVALGNTDEGLERYYQAQDRLLDEVWDEDVLEARLDAAVALTEDHVWPDGGDDGAWQDTVENIRDFIQDRRSNLTHERDFGDAQVSEDFRDSPCLLDQGDIALSFETTWGSYGTLPTFSTGSGAWTLEYGGNAIDVTFLGAVVGETQGYSILFVSGQLASGANIGFYAVGEGNSAYETAGERELWGDLDAYLLYNANGDYSSWQTWAYLGGDLSLDVSGTDFLDQVAGEVTVDIFAGDDGG